MKARTRRSAFSLIEVVLAIGIIAFAFVSIVGLVPVGLATLNRAIDSTVTSQIVQQLVTEAQQMSYTNLSNFSGGRNFDSEGVETSNNTDFVYQAYIYPPTKQFLSNSYVNTLRIEVSKNLSVSEQKVKNPAAVKSFTFMVADTGT